MVFPLLGNYFNGKFHANGKLQDSDIILKRHCPADLDTTLWEIPVKYSDVEKVLQSAKEGFEVWRKVPLEERIICLQNFKSEVAKRKDEFARSISLESGKPLWEAHTEVSSVMSKVDVTINDSLPRILPKHFDNILPDTNGHIYYRPIGPCFIIGPFNFPCHLANGQITAALIAGNSIIFKPSEKTSHCGQLLIECYAKAGFPKGVINLIQGDGEVARRITKEKMIKGIFFTGSAEVGKNILSSTYLDFSKLVALEMGGKNSSIIHKDANLDHCLVEMLKACFLTTGQRCISTSLVPIHRSVADSFIEKFHSYAKRLIIDHPIDHEVEPFMGPLVDQHAVDNYLNFMGMAKREGIQEIMRGKLLEKNFKGHYVSPSIHYTEKFSKKSHFLMSEIFGPNCTFIPYDEIEEAIAIANGTEFGLAASVFSNDQSVYQKCIQEIDAGQVNFNRSTVGASSRLPFGGVKSSGNYRPAALTTIDSCVFQMASLDIVQFSSEDADKIKGVGPS